MNLRVEFSSIPILQNQIKFGRDNFFLHLSREAKPFSGISNSNASTFVKLDLRFLRLFA
jgi:hypothetical protein